MRKIEVISSQETQENKADVIIVNGETFTFKASGLTRRVFANADKTKVVKIPTRIEHSHHNDDEIRIYSEATEENKKQMAETTLLDNGYIMQEYLHSLDDATTTEWLNRPMTMKEIRFANSCRRDVGFDKEGTLKCFDLPEFKLY